MQYLIDLSANMHQATVPTFAKALEIMRSAMFAKARMCGPDGEEGDAEIESSATVGDDGRRSWELWMRFADMEEWCPLATVREVE